jgi:hypothetical protein
VYSTDEIPQDSFQHLLDKLKTRATGFFPFPSQANITYVLKKKKGVEFM